MVAACSRCENEIDVAEHPNGRRYCAACLTCPHGENAAEAVCVDCLLNLYTLVTPVGQRITDPEIYVIDAWQDYGLTWFDLRTLTLDDMEAVTTFGDRWLRPERREGWREEPPHHRLTQA